MIRAHINTSLYVHEAEGKVEIQLEEVEIPV